MRRALAQLPVIITLVASLAVADPPARTDELAKAQSFVTFKHSGYFRLRSDLFYRADLGNDLFHRGDLLGNGSFHPSLGGSDDSVLGSANMRFRWQPELAIGQAIRVGTVIDVLDNAVLGSSPDWAPDRADAPLAFLSETQASPSSASDGLKKSLRVKQLWGEWDIAHSLLLRVGRMADHWGLGVVHNGGECLDCDFGDTTDRASILIQAIDLQSLWFFDYPGEGTTSARRVDPFGQAIDETQMDDVYRWGFTLGQTPLGRVALEKRTRDLASRKVVVDWGLRNTFTSQALSSDVPTARPKPDDGKPDPDCSILDPLARPYDCKNLQKRDASFWLPDAWLKLQWRQSLELAFRAELELAAVYGSVGFTQNVVEPSSDRDFLGFGGVLQLELQHRKLTYSLETGFATGDDVVFGPYGPDLTVPDAEYPQDVNERLRADKNVTRFLFNRDYHVDLLLYREVIGAVTNSVYVKPTVRAHLIANDAMVIGAEASVLYAHAIDTASTPGHEAPLGIEEDVRLFYEEPNALRIDIEAGLLEPLGALRNGQGGRDPKIAFTLQARLTAQF